MFEVRIRCLNGHVQDRIPLREMLIGHGLAHLAEPWGSLGAEYADDLAFLGPQDLIVGAKVVRTQRRTGRQSRRCNFPDSVSAQGM